MIVYSTVYHDADGAHPVTMELRFPDIALLERDRWEAFLGNDAVFADHTKFTIALTSLGATKDFNVLTEPPADQTSYIQQYWNGVFYLSFTITLTGSGETINIKNAALRVFADNAVRDAVDATPGGHAVRRSIARPASSCSIARRRRQRPTRSTVPKRRCKAIAISTRTIASFRASVSRMSRSAPMSR